MHLILKKVLGSQGTEHKRLAEFDHYPAAEPGPESRTWGLSRELTSLPSVTLRSTGTLEICLVEDTVDPLSPSSVLESDIRLSLHFFGSGHLLFSFHKRPTAAHLLPAG